MNSKNLARNVVRLNALTKTTKSELAAMTGLSSSTIRRIHNMAPGSATTWSPKFSTVEKLANFAGISIEDFASKRL